MSEPVLRTLEK